MTIPAPILDDSNYNDLRKRLVDRIPVFNPEWTDHNPSDPGITLLELFAYLGEHVIHRFNQIPETTYVEYLNLLQIARRAAEPSQALIRFESESLPVSPINAGSQLTGGKIKFETATVVDVWPVQCRPVLKAQAELPETDSDEYSQVLLAMDALDVGDDADPIGYEVVDIAKQQDGAVVDASATVDGMIWLAVLNNSDQSNADVVQAMKESEAIINIGFSPDQAPPNIEDIEPCPGPNAEQVAGAVQWQVSTDQVIDADEPKYAPCLLAGDSTAGLRSEGIVRIKIPSSVGQFTYIDDDVRGAGDLPPSLDEETQETLLFWVRAFRIDDDGFNLIRLMDINISDCVQQVSATPEYLGIGNAQPNQQVRLSNAPIVSGSLVLEIEGLSGWQAWGEVDGFHSSLQDDAHYMLDRISGLVTFGSKKTPQIGQRIRARRYQHGGGRQGNVAVDTITKISGAPGVSVSNPLPAYGGSDDESMSDSLARMPDEIRRKDRAVTPDDFKELAEITPGAGIQRAETLDLFRPKTRETNAAGVVSVVVLPEQPADPAQAPMPTRTQLRQVCQWLDQRRLVTTEVYVIPPVYRSIAIAVGLNVKSGFSVDAVRVWVETVLRQYLAPLPPFGPEGSGWPLGRPIHAPELEAAVLQVEGVEYLEGLDIAVFNEATSNWDQGRIELALDQLPWLLEITVVEGAPLVPGEAIGAPTTDGLIVPVPILVEEC